MKINRIFAEIVEQKGIKQAYLAEKTGMTADMISKILRGERRIMADEFLTLCEVLDVSPELFRSNKVA